MISTRTITAVLDILKRERKKFQVPALTELAEVTKDPFKVLISCILSLRTKDAVTVEASKRLYSLAGDVYMMSKLDTQQIAKAIYPVGFYKTKAKRIKEICNKLIDEHTGKVPADFNELLKFKGVGKKTAAITMTYGFRKNDFIAVDSHAHQISNRLGWVKTKNPEETMDRLMEIVPRKYWIDVNDLFVQFGQNICVPVSPWCSKCPVRKRCQRISVKISR